VTVSLVMVTRREHAVVKANIGNTISTNKSIPRPTKNPAMIFKILINKQIYFFLYVVQ